jgi:hypothetical protein
LFSQPIGYLVRVHRLAQGYLKSSTELRFAFQTAITQISPTSGKIALSIDAASETSFCKGSIAGGTQVTIDGFGFQPGLTIVFIADHIVFQFHFSQLFSS